MNRLTAIGLASLVAYGLLLASKYSAVMSATRDEKAPRPPAVALGPEAAAPIAPPREEPRPVDLRPLLPIPVARQDAPRATAVAMEFRQAHDLKAFADALMSRKADLTSDERYHLAKALEECQFATSLTEDIATYAAKQRRQFV